MILPASHPARMPIAISQIKNIIASVYLPVYITRQMRPFTSSVT
jgi:hypothetical protein